MVFNYQAATGECSINEARTAEEYRKQKMDKKIDDKLKTSGSTRYGAMMGVDHMHGYIKGKKLPVYDKNNPEHHANAKEAADHEESQRNNTMNRDGADIVDHVINNKNKEERKKKTVHFDNDMYRSDVFNRLNKTYDAIERHNRRHPDKKVYRTNETVQNLREFYQGDYQSYFYETYTQ